MQPYSMGGPCYSACAASFHEKTRYLVNQADLKGVGTVLKVLAVEYVDAGLNLKEFWAAMQDEIDSVSNSLSLHDVQR